MIFKQFRYEPLGQASYLIGCARAKEALVVDPIADLGADFYIVEAADLTLGIVGVLETHVHADFISCARELADASGATTTCPSAIAGDLSVRRARGRSGTDDRPEFGSGVAHARTHAGALRCLVTDLARSPDPWFVLSGDSLFVGDVGRPDLLIGDQAVDVIDERERAATLRITRSTTALRRFPITSRCIRLTTADRPAAAST